MYGFCSVYGSMVRIIPNCMVWYGMVWYGNVSKHKHKESLGMFGSVVERLETFCKRLNAF